MEKAMYEFKPFICLALAYYAFNHAAIVSPMSAAIAKVAGFTLIISGLLIIYMRGHSRGYFK